MSINSINNPQIELNTTVVPFCIESDAFLLESRAVFLRPELCYLLELVTQTLKRIFYSEKNWKWRRQTLEIRFESSNSCFWESKVLERPLLSPGTSFSCGWKFKTCSDLCTTLSTIPIKRQSESTSCRRLCTWRIERCDCNCGIRPGRNDSGKYLLLFVYFLQKDYSIVNKLLTKTRPKFLANVNNHYFLYFISGHLFKSTPASNRLPESWSYISVAQALILMFFFQISDSKLYSRFNCGRCRVRCDKYQQLQPDEQVDRRCTHRTRNRRYYCSRW